MSKKHHAVLATDGSSDKLLTHVLRWLWDHHTEMTLELEWFDPAFSGPTHAIRDRVEQVMKQHAGVDLLFVHRDAETDSLQARINEIQDAIASVPGTVPPYICVIPVRMTEAWLLFDESAIRAAVGNPNGKMPLNLPPLSQIEKERSPKEKLFEVLKTASGLSGRHLRNFRPEQHRHEVVEFIEDFGPLRQLPAFQRLEADVREYLDNL